MNEQIEIVEEAIASENNNFLGNLRRVLLAGVGAVVLTQEEVEAFVNKLVERGEIANKDGRRLINDIIRRPQKRMRNRTEKAEEEIDRRIERLITRLNIPTKAEIQSLNDRIAELSRKVDELKHNAQ